MPSLDWLKSLRENYNSTSSHRPRLRHEELICSAVAAYVQNLEPRVMLTAEPVVAVLADCADINVSGESSLRLQQPQANDDPSMLTQFLVDQTHRYDHSENPSDVGSPAVFFYTDYFAGGAYTNITATGGMAGDGLDGNDPDAARGTSSFRMTTNAAHGYCEVGLAKSNNSPRDIPEYGAVHALRFWAKGDSSGQTLKVNVLATSFLVQTVSLTTNWAEYVVDLSAGPTLSPADIQYVQFQLPSVGTVRLDEVRLNTDGTDPLQLMQSYVPGGWAATNSDPNSAAGRDATVYPNRSFLYDVALAAKALIASGDSANRMLALNQIDTTLATAGNGTAGYFNERSSGYVLLADGSARAPNTLRRTVGDNSWFGLALLDAHRLTGNEVYLTRAREISDWLENSLKNNGTLKGYLGGYDEFGNAVPWRSTEYNIDAFEFNRQIASVLTLRGESAAAQTYTDRAAHAATFVIGMFESTEGKIWTGTTTGDTINQSSVPLDAQLFPLLTLSLSSEYATAAEWSRALQYAELHLVQTDGPTTGFTFSTNATANRVWSEGVAQGVAVYHVIGDTMKEQAGLLTLEQLVVPGGGVLAVSSGTMQDPSLNSVYDARQAVAPSAWSYLAHIGQNPFAENHVPTAFAITTSINEDTPLNGGLLWAYDPETPMDQLIFSITSPPTHGTVTKTGIRGFRYVPNVNFNGADSFQFTASDGVFTSAPATVTINVLPINDAPIAFAITPSINEDTPLNGGLLWAYDPETPMDQLAFNITTPTTHGTVTLTGQRSFRYTPSANFNGTDTFQFTVSDGQLTSSPATVTINVQPVNDAPTAFDIQVTTNRNTPINGGLLWAFDVETPMDQLSFVITSPTTHGTVTKTGIRSFNYSPTLNYTGSDAFQFTVSDGQFTSAPATVMINIVPPSLIMLDEPESDTPRGYTIPLSTETDNRGAARSLSERSDTIRVERPPAIEVLVAPDNRDTEQPRAEMQSRDQSSAASATPRLASPPLTGTADEDDSGLHDLSEYSVQLDDLSSGALYELVLISPE